MLRHELDQMKKKDRIEFAVTITWIILGIAIVALVIWSSILGLR